MTADGPHRLDRLDIAVTVEAPQELNHSSYVLAGLFDLDHAGRLGGLRFVPTARNHRGEVHVGEEGDLTRSPFRAYKAVYLTVAARREVRVVIDLRDAADIVPVDGLEADLLFKRSFRPSVVDRLSSSSVARIEPAGLSFAVRSRHERATFARMAGFAATTVRYNTRLDRDAGRRLLRESRAAWRHARRASEHPGTWEFGGRVSEHDPVVAYRTRTFDRIDDPDAVAVHEQRAAVIRGLRNGLGDRFDGGFVSTEFARRHYPDCIVDGPSDPESYRQAMARAAVVVSTRGLAGSAPWKLAESLGRGSCVVTDPITTRLPSALDATVTTFDEIDECVEACRGLLADGGRREEMGRRAQAYYRRWIDPAAGVHRMLTLATRLAGG